MSARDGLTRLAATFEDIVGVVLLAGIAAIVMQQVVRRYAMGSPSGWSEEASRVLLAWITFVGASAVLRDDAHPRFLLLRDALSAHGRRAVDVIVDAGVILLAGCSATYGFYLVSQVTTISLVTINLSWAWWYGALPVGAVLMLLRVAERWGRVFRGGGVQAGPNQYGGKQDGC